MAEQSLTKARIVKLPRRSLHRIQDLQEQGVLPATQDITILTDMTKRYAVAVTPAMLDQIDKDNLEHDPIAKQFIPDSRELITLPEETVDPIGDYPHSPLKALVHRHKNRVLLKPTLACAVYCRFCFRREMIGPHGDTVTSQDVTDALDYIAAHPEIKEVILTGGDPLVLGVSRLQAIMQRLHAIPHLDWIRIHTRIPVVQPDKMSPDILKALDGPKNVTFALHINHVRELSDAAIAALDNLHHAGHLMVSQSVLLRGINDSVESLTDLFHTLVKHRVKPYYLHHADLSAGTSHFRVSLEKGMQLMREVRQHVSGLAIPDYVLDIPGGVAKIPVNSDYVQKIAGQPGAYRLIDPQGNVHLYQDSAVI